MTTPSKYDSAWSDTMLNMADVWETYDSTTSYTRPVATEHGIEVRQFTDVPCRRCRACDEPLIQDDTAFRAQHMVMFHGYRMDGRKEEDQ